MDFIVQPKPYSSLLPWFFSAKLSTRTSLVYGPWFSTLYLVLHPCTVHHNRTLLSLHHLAIQDYFVLCILNLLFFYYFDHHLIFSSHSSSTLSLVKPFASHAHCHLCSMSACISTSLVDLLISFIFDSSLVEPLHHMPIAIYIPWLHVDQLHLWT